MESKNELTTLKIQDHYCEINEMMGLSRDQAVWYKFTPILISVQSPDGWWDLRFEYQWVCGK